MEEREVWSEICQLKKQICYLQQLVEKSLVSHVHRKIPIPVKEGYVFIQPEEIIRCQADGNYTFIYLCDGRRFLQSETLKEIENEIHVDQFVRVHQSHLVNIDFISRYQRNGGHYLVMKDNSIIPISRQKKNLILEILNLY